MKSNQNERFKELGEEEEVSITGGTDSYNVWILLKIIINLLFVRRNSTIVL